MSDEYQYVPPVVNPADNNEAGAANALLDLILMKIEKVAPAQVVSYDRNKNRATVQILNQSMYSNGAKLTKKAIPDIPVYMMSGGGFILSFPLKPKDTGWIIAADRDISIFKKLLSVFTPATIRKHKYEDGFFLPDYVKGLSVSIEDNAVTLTSEDGTTNITLKDGQIILNSNETIINSENTTISGNVTVADTLTAQQIISLNGATGTYTTSVTSESGIVTAGS